ncbi:hypothetical protein [Streptomyces sp. SPB074]|uniref:hypothetical protein n=1 Tax=Streptomyces sp. (strain SPB074) TaxID=465543 RepID=UPI00017F1916|nr:hypothetical protein [Streptomyces sp. SPB074]
MIGEIVWDARREVLAVVTGRLGRYWWLRPLGGGREWNAGPDEVRRLPEPGTYGERPGPGPAFRVADDALACRLGTTTRGEMERHTRLLRELAETALAAEVPAETGALPRALLGSVPPGDAPAFAAYAHMQALARLLRQHAAGERAALEARCAGARWGALS